MKIISVIIDELPECCNDCLISHPDIDEYGLLCSANPNEFIINPGKIQSDCPLRVMPSDEDVQNIEFMTGSWSYDQGIEDGVNWLKSKLT